jgi:O-antigen ligase
MDLAYKRFLESPYFGWGPAKSIHSTIIDSEFVLILQRYGTIGILVFLLYIATVITFSVKLIKKYGQRHIEPKMLFLFMTTGLFVMTTNVIFAGYQTTAILILLIILNASLYRYKKRKRILKV